MSWRARGGRWADWFYTVDRATLSAGIALMLVGLVVAFATSPAIAERKDVPAFYFAIRQAAFAVPAIMLMVAVSMLSLRRMRQLALVMVVSGLTVMALVLVLGPDINGARRWLRLGFLSLQPAEFVKPGLIVLSAWLFAEARVKPDMPAYPLAAGLLAVFCLLLFAQPDAGQAVLVAAVWGALFLASGPPVVWVMGCMGAAALGFVAVFLTKPHITDRIEAFFAPIAPNSQIGKAMRSFIEGGWFGRGPGEGTVKHDFPDAHTDFAFSVVAEEFGVAACLGIVALFAFIVARGSVRGLREQDPFIRSAIVGLTLLLGVQAFINMAVNVALVPAKGMTLPFVSYGGSSLWASAITLGMALGFMRKRPAGQEAEGIAPRKPVDAHIRKRATVMARKSWAKGA